MGYSDAAEAKVGGGFCVWDEGAPFVISFNTGWGQGVTNSNGQNSYLIPTGKGASTNQSHPYSIKQGDGDNVDLTISRQSQDSQHSQRLIIYQTQEWSVEEEYEMHSVQDRT
ncbi:unnamed protein product [Penicillium glandicola]